MKKPKNTPNYSLNVENLSQSENNRLGQMMEALKKQLNEKDALLKKLTNALKDSTEKEN